jgi:hypothetical protein
MAEYKLTIPGLLPGLNEYINAERRNKYQAAAMKKQAEHLIISLCRTQLKGVYLIAINMRTGLKRHMT